MKIIKKIILKIIPIKLLNIYGVSKIFLFKYGYLKSVEHRLSIDKECKPLPWFTYPSIEYINQFNLKDKNVFEYGSGYSSLYFAREAKEITSVEDDKKWFDKISKNKPSNLNIIFKKDKNEYLSSIEKLNMKFDIIIIDASYRLDCCAYVKNNLNSGGIVILDNSDWFNDCANYLKNELNLIQIDFFGFGPINSYTWTTSIFISRDFNFEVKNNIQPQMSIGGIK